MAKAKQETNTLAMEEKILAASKEITVKFIEVGRISPNTFPETFKIIYDGVRQAVLSGQTSENSVSDE